MTAETDLARLLRDMRPELKRDVYVFVTLPRGTSVPKGLAPVMIFNEAEGVTLVVPQGLAKRMGLSGVYPCRMITLNVRSALNAVGFLATIATRLAEAGISVNPVSAFYHDHLFIGEDRADEALALLQALAAGSAA